MRAAPTGIESTIKKIETLVRKTKDGDTNALKDLNSFLHDCLNSLTPPQKKATKAA